MYAKALFGSLSRFPASSFAMAEGYPRPARLRRFPAMRRDCRAASRAGGERRSDHAPASLREIYEAATLSADRKRIAILDGAGHNARWHPEFPEVYRSFLSLLVEEAERRGDRASSEE
jgi:hypothetical protein